jgi:hypothetical protein
MISRRTTAAPRTIAAPIPAGIHGVSSWPSFKIPHTRKKKAMATDADKM